MRESADSARSSVIKSLSDSQMVQPPVKSHSCRGLFVEEMSTSEARAGDKMWVLLANAVDDEVTVSIGCEEVEREVEGLVQKDKLLIFTIPYFAPETDTEGQLSIKSSGNRMISIPFTLRVRADSSPPAAPQIDASHLFKFAECGDSQILVKPFTSLFTKQDNEGNTILHLSARNQQSYSMRIFLSACDEMTEEKKKSFLNKKNARGQTALHCAIRAGDADSVHYLVAHGSAVNIADNHKNTALHYLGDAYNEAIFKEVLEPRGFSIEEELSSRNDEGLTPLHIAVRRLKLSLIEMLLDVGANVDEEDDQKRTPLMHAIMMNDPEIVNFCIQKGANVNHQDKDGDTPLLLTKQIGNFYIMGALIDNGADTSVKNGKGVCLEESEDPEVIKVLRGERIAADFKLCGQRTDGTVHPALFGRSAHLDDNSEGEDRERNGVDVDDLPGSSRTLASVQAEGPIMIPMSASFDDSEGEEEPETLPPPGRPSHLSESEQQPSTSSSEARPRKSRFETKAFVKDDISSLDYLTRLRLSKILDETAKWIDLANELCCGHMIELIQICADDSSPTMIFLDQYEQMPTAKISCVREALNRLQLEEAVKLIDNRMIL